MEPESNHRAALDAAIALLFHFASHSGGASDRGRSCSPCKPMKTTSDLKMPIAVLISFVLFLGCLFGLAMEEVLGPSRSLLRQFWICFAATAALAIATFVVTRCHRFCARLADAEDAIAIRFRGKPSSRSLESRSCKIGVWILFGLFASLTLVIGGTYLHFKSDEPTTPNKAHPLDGGFPSCFGMGRHWSAPSDEHRWVRNEAMCALLSDYREWFGFRKPAR
jgi:hypothetical protein